MNRLSESLGRDSALATLDDPARFEAVIAFM